MDLLNRTIELIKEAYKRGFEMDHAIHPVMFESWMNAEVAFCNVACSILSMWLREKDIYVCTAGPVFGGFSFFLAQPFNQKVQPHSLSSHNSWEEAWLAGIEEAIKLL